MIQRFNKQSTGKFSTSVFFMHYKFDTRHYSATRMRSTDFYLTSFILHFSVCLMSLCVIPVPVSILVSPATSTITMAMSVIRTVAATLIIITTLMVITTSVIPITSPESKIIYLTKDLLKINNEIKQNLQISVLYRTKNLIEVYNFFSFPACHTISIL